MKTLSRETPSQNATFFISLLLSIIPFIYTHILGFSQNIFAVADSLVLSSLLFLTFGILIFKLKKIGIQISLLFTCFILIFLYINNKYYAYFNGYISYETIYLFADLVRSLKSFSLVNIFLCLLISIFSFFGTYKCFVYLIKNKFTKISLTAQILTICLISVLTCFFHFSARTLNPLGLKTNSNYSYDYTSENPLMYFFRSMPVIKNDNNAQEMIELSAGLQSGKVKTLPENMRYRSFSGLVPDSKNYQHAGNPLEPLKFIPIFKTKQNEKKNVIIITLESIRAYEASLFLEGKAIMPRLQSIIKQGIQSKNAYSTGRYTIKSEEAILCSMIDSNMGTPYSTLFGEFKGKCLPKILTENGYSSFWFHGNNKEFYNRKVFHESLGFQFLYDKKELLKISNVDNLGWGLPDDFVFSTAINLLKKQKSPFIAEILSISNHLPFNWSYPEENIPDFLAYEGELTYKNYLKGIAYTDYALGVFWDKFINSPLKDNTIVVITGDHGVPYYPDIKLSETEKFEILFKTPLVIYGAEESQVNDKIRLSHLDITPTILSILNITSENNFLGRAFLGKDKTLSSRPIFNFEFDNYSFKFGDINCLPIESFCQSATQTRCYKTAQFTCEINNENDIRLIEESSNMIKYLNLGNRIGFPNL